MIGEKFGRLTVTGTSAHRSADGKLLWSCACECGRTTRVTSHKLKSGHTRSCGCLFKEQLSRRNTIHGMSDAPEYKVWRKMKDRCLNPNNKDFCHYGGRGISVCDEWRDSFQAFFDDVGPRPEGMTLERINNDSGYHPGNVRWASRKRQANNTRRNVLVTYQGETLNVSQWARRTGMRRRLLAQRIRAGWPPEKALTEPVK